MEKVKCKTPPVPDGTTVLEHQVAGHFFGEGTTKFGFLQHSDGSILKPCQSPPRGLRELQFYQWICDPDQPLEDLVRLRKFLPKFLGTWSTPEHPDVLYIKLEDLTKQFSHPCIADAKIGPITYDPEASLEKRQRELAKFKDLPRVGFRFTGIRVYEWDSLTYKKLENDHMKLFSAEEVFNKGMVTFLNLSSDSSNLFVILSFLRRLMLLKKWFLSQRQLQFIASSLLMVYDGDLIKQKYTCDACSALINQKHSSILSENLVSNDTVEFNSRLYSTGDSMYPCKQATELLRRISSSSCDRCDSFTAMKMIDFAHVFPDEKLDENYIFGMDGLISHFVHALSQLN